MADISPDDGEGPVIVSVIDAAMHMFSAAIEDLPEPNDSEFPHRAGVILVGLRKLQAAAAQAARRSRVTPAVIVSLSKIRLMYDDLMTKAADANGSTLGQRLYVARLRAKLSAKEAANGAGLRADLLEAIESEEPSTEDESTKIKSLIEAITSN